MIGPYFGSYVVVITIMLTKYFPYNHKVATSATAISPKYNLNHLTACAFVLYGRKFSAACYAHDSNDEVLCIKVEVLNNREEFDDSCCSRGGL